METLIANTVYKGVYTEKTTGTFFDNIKFWEWKPPIESDLWERANAKVGKRGHGFGEWQAEHIAQWILKHESGKNLYLYKAKGKYNAYQTEIVWDDGKRKSIGIMETALVKGFLSEVIPKIINLHYKVYMLAKEERQIELEADHKKLEVLMNIERKRIDPQTEKEMNTIFEEFNQIQEAKKLCYKKFEKYSLYKKLKDSTQEWRIEIYKRSFMETETNEYKELMAEYWNITKKEHIFYWESKIVELKEIIESKEWYILEKSNNVLKSFFEQSPIFDSDREWKILQEKQKVELENKKLVLEEEKKTIRKNGIKWGYTAEETNETIADTEKEIQSIEDQIKALWESTDMEQYLERLPEIVQKLHELSSKVLSEADYEGMRNDIKQLIEIVSHELILNNKKELKVKLSEVLENLETDKIWNGATSRARTCDLLLRREAL